MANWDDVSSPTQQTQPQPQGGSWDAVSSPVSIQAPDTTGIQKTVQDNLSASKVEDTEGKSQEPQTPSQKIDTGLGMPVSGILGGGNKEASLPPDIRGHLMDSYAKGTSQNAGDFMQATLPTIANAVLPGSVTSLELLTTPASEINNALQRTGRDVVNAAGMVAGFIPDSVARLEYTGAQALGLVPKSESVDEMPTVSGAFQKLGEMVFPDGSPQNEVARRVDQAATMTATLPLGGGATMGVSAWRATYLSAAGIFGPEAQKAATDWAQKTFPDQPFIQESISQAANLAVMLGIAKSGHMAEQKVSSGHAALQPIVGDAIGKPAAEVTSQDINNTIAQGFTDKAPKAQDFHDVASVMNSDPGFLREVYKETGVHPDQVFEDAKNNPAIAADISSGKVPSAYDELRVKPEMQSLVLVDKKAESNLSTEGASESKNPLSKIFNPAGMSESSRDMATALRQGRGPETRDVAVIQDSLQKYAKDFSSMNDKERLAFIDYLENRTKGAVNPLPHTQEAADAIRDIYEQIAEKIKTQFPDAGLRQDYFTHQYEDSKAAAKFFSDWTAKQGSSRNLKERAFPTLSEAMEAGLKPKTTNPIETVMNYATNMSKLLGAHRSLELAQEAGIADYFKNGQQPDGWIPLEGNLSTKGGKQLFAPEDAARVYNNDISEKASGPFGDILDGIQRANNFVSKLVLGLSGYHFTATTMASMASDVARAITGSGDLVDRAKALGQAITPFANAREGGRLINAYLGKEELSPELQKALDLAVKNNTINIKQQDYWKAGPAKDYVDVFKNGSASTELSKAGETLKEHPISGIPRIIGNELGRIMDTISKPLFDVYIPRIKISANIQELHAWMKDHPDATPHEQDRAAQSIGNSIDNRFGEMMRDNLFWHQLTRQTLQTALLSYSWVTGGARMLKGIPDAASTIMGKQELSSNAKYLFGMAATYAVVNGVRTYIGTGKAPDDWKDFIYPRTGGATPQGKEEREILPSHIGQFTNYLHEGLEELGNELSPGLKLVYHLTTNQDFRGLPITNDNNPWFGEQRWEDYLKYALGEITPIGLKTFVQGNKKGSKITTEEQVLGARQAPRFVTDPEGYASMMKRINQKEFEKKERADEHTKAQFE